MSDNEERAERAREAIERVIAEYVDVFCADENESELQFRVPDLKAFVLLTAHEDVTDPTVWASHYMTKKHQWLHESVGMLRLASFHLLGEKD